MDYLIWSLIAVSALAAELLTRAKIAIFFLPAALLAMLPAYLTGILWMEIAVFLSASAVLIVIRIIFLRSGTPLSSGSLNAEDIVGSKCRVIEKIENIAGSGLVRCKGIDFAARALDDETFLVGDTVTAVALEGARLVCKKN